MIVKLKDFNRRKPILEADDNSLNTDPQYNKKLKIKWTEPDLGQEVIHYDDKAKIEFYQHNITIGNRDIGKVSPRATKFYKYIIEPFRKGKYENLPIVSEDSFNISKIQNLMDYEFDNIVNGSYGKSYGDVLVTLTNDLKSKGELELPAPIVIRFVNFGETRTSSESSYYLFSGNRRINLALQYNIPVKIWVVDLIPSRRDVREFAKKMGALKNPSKFRKILRRSTGKDNIDDLSARERFKIIQSLKNF
jgi:hypothetical protein